MCQSSSPVKCLYFPIFDRGSSTAHKIKDGVNAAINAMQKLIDRASDP